MNVLTSPRVSQLLERLFADAAQSDAVFRERFAGIPAEERQRRTRDPNAYRELYGLAKDLYLAVSPESARLLYVLARSSGAKNIVEFGTSFGVSTIHLAAALRDGGGGRLVGSELEPEKVVVARKNLADAGLLDLVDVREGDALETLARDLPEIVDLLLLDGHKPLYERVLELVRPRLRPGALVVADNADMAPGYVARVRSGGGFVSVGLDDDLELSLVL